MKTCTKTLPNLRPTLALLAATAILSSASGAEGPPVVRSWGVPSGEPQGVEGECSVRVAEAFRALHPEARLEPSGGLVLPGGRGMDTTPLMQIAGDVAPDAMYVNFRQSDTYVRNRFLMPLDAWLEREDGLAPEATRKAHRLPNPEYLDLLRTGPRSAMWFSYLDQDTFQQIDPNLIGFGPVPRGPSGRRGSEYNCGMLGVYAGSGDRDPRVPELAWEWAWFMGGREARKIRTRTYVENGLGRFVPPSALREAGFDPEAFACPEGWDEAAAVARENGVPEPYGRNCQLVYTYMSRAIDQARNDGAVRDAIRRGDLPAARERIGAILRERVALADEKMIGRVPPEKMRFRRRARRSSSSAWRSRSSLSSAA